jgi:hypothetical protein
LWDRTERIVKDVSQVFARAARKAEMPFHGTEAERIKFAEVNLEFSFGSVVFVMSTRHPVKMLSRKLVRCIWSSE